MKYLGIWHFINFKIHKRDQSFKLNEPVKEGVFKPNNLRLLRRNTIHRL